MDIAELEKLSVSLREIENRHTTPRETIKQVCDTYVNSTTTSLSTAAVKVLANYVSDVPDNAKFVFELVNKILPVSSTDEMYTTVQIVLLQNILTTCEDIVIDAGILERVVEAACDVDVEDELVVELLDDLSKFVKNVKVDVFMKLRDLMLKYGSTESMEIVLTCSIKVDGNEKTDSGKQDVFFELYEEVNNAVDEQILLNVSYQLGINSNEFFDKLIDKVFVEGELIAKKKAMAMLLVSNEIISKERMDFFLMRINIPKLIETYFIDVYPKMSFKQPWELQSIVLLNKIPLDKVVMNEQLLAAYITQLRNIINSTTIQINNEVATLQLVFLSRIFDGQKEVIDLINHLKAGNFGLAFNYTLNKFYFSYLTKNRDNKSLVKETITEARLLFVESVETKNPIHITYLLEFSKIMGIYAETCVSEDWFLECFTKFEELFQDLDAQVRKMKDGQEQAWMILENNIKFTKSFIK